MEGESGGETEGRRGFQGEPLLGLPLGRVIRWPVRLAEESRAPGEGVWPGE
jgi:hypothetical protein